MKIFPARDKCVQPSSMSCVCQTFRRLCIPFPEPRDSFLIKFIEVTLVNKITRVSNVQFYDIICVLHLVFTTQSQISFHHHTVDPGHPWLPPPLPFPLVTTIPLTVSVSSRVFVVLFFICILIFYIWVKLHGSWLFLSALFHLAWHSPGPPTS